MTQTLTLSEIQNLFSLLDGQTTFSQLMETFTFWLKQLPGVQEARFHGLQELLPHFPDPEDFPDQAGVSLAGCPAFHFLVQHPWREEGLVFYPLHSRKGKILGLVLLRSSDPLDALHQNQALVDLAAGKLRDLHSLQNYADDPLLNDTQTGSRAGLPELRHVNPLFQIMNLPLYTMDLQGQFLFVNQPFLRTFGYHSLEELNRHREHFFSATARRELLLLLMRGGSVSGYSLEVRHADGSRFHVKEYSNLRGGLILGLLFDVSEFVSQNNEMQEALEIQELLNNQIMSSALILQKTQTTSVRALARLAEYRDQETGGHLQRICEYTGILARRVLKHQPYEFRISEQYVNDIVLSSMLHDIGKVAVPDMILRKKQGLIASEWEIMKKHTIWGWQILHQADKELGEQSFLTLATQIAVSHHERWDGTGYPYGLQGQKIPLSGRIEAIADVYDALTSVRPYKHAWTHEEALEEMISLREKQFDPVLVDIFLECAEDFRQVKSQYTGETS